MVQLHPWNQPLLSSRRRLAAVAGTSRSSAFHEGVCRMRIHEEEFPESPGTMR